MGHLLHNCRRLLFFKNFIVIYCILSLCLLSLYLSIFDYFSFGLPVFYTTFLFSICLLVFLSCYLFVFLSICLYVFLYFCLFVFLSFCLFVFVAPHLSMSCGSRSAKLMRSGRNLCRTAQKASPFFQLALMLLI